VNNTLVHGIAKSNNADYVEMYQMVLVKPGGSPEVGLELHPAGSQNEFRYRVYNPELVPMEHFFLELALQVHATLNSSQVVPPAGWNVEFWSPSGTTSNRVSSLNPTGAADDGLDLFAPPFAVENGGENPLWQPNWGGLHFYWTGQAGTRPVQTNAILDFSLFLNTSAFGLDSNSSLRPSWARRTTRSTILA
jgi:hypothetical protein